MNIQKLKASKMKDERNLFGSHANVPTLHFELVSISF